MKKIKEANEMLDLPSHTKQVAFVYYYQCLQFLKENPVVPLDLVAAACVNLACKQTGITRKLRDVVNVFYYLEHQESLEIGSSFWKLKDSVIKVENIVLRVLRFDTEVEDCFSALVNLLRDEEDLLFIQTSWACLNDLVSLDRICEIQVGKAYFSKVIALGAMWIALKLMGKNIPIRQVYFF
jgi:hypothetical protein